MKQFYCALFLPLLLANWIACAADPLAGGPRDGKYLIYTYGAPTSPPIFLGFFTLSSGTYKAYLPGDKTTGEGRCSYNAETHILSWDSGPYAGVWKGEFTIEREGKTHKLRLKSNTVATNSTDS
jgi:hypothetical protein